MTYGGCGGFSAETAAKKFLCLGCAAVAAFLAGALVLEIARPAD